MLAMEGPHTRDGTERTPCDRSRRGSPSPLHGRVKPPVYRDSCIRVSLMCLRALVQQNNCQMKGLIDLNQGASTFYMYDVNSINRGVCSPERCGARAAQCVRSVSGRKPEAP